MDRKQKNLVYFEVEYGSEFQQELFQDMRKAIVIGALFHREGKHKGNKIRFIDALHPTKDEQCT